jgi:hypothetical protein
MSAATSLASSRPESEVRNPNTERIALWIHAEIAQLSRRRMAIAERQRAITGVLTGLQVVFGVEMQTERAYTRPTQLAQKRKAREELIDACRQTLRKLCEPVTTKELFEEVRKASPGVLFPYKRPLMTVALIVAQLAENGEVTNIEKQGNSRKWRWNDPRSV